MSTSSQRKTYNSIMKTTLEKLEQQLRPKKAVHTINQTDISKFTDKELASGSQKNYVTNRLSHLRNFFKYLQDSGYYPKGLNPADGHLTVTKKDRQKSAARGWHPFTPEELKAIFEPDNFRLLNGRDQWICLLSLYTGARPNEISQLDCLDITHKDGYDCISINELGEGQSVKNQYSKRVIPIHPELLGLGFMDMVSAVRMAGHSAVFPDLNRTTQNGPSQAPGKAVSRYFKGIGIEARGDSKNGLRRFRDNAVTAMAEAGVTQSWREKYSGHELGERLDETAHAMAYTQNKNLISILASQCFPPLNWSEKGVINLTEIRKILK